MGKKIAAVSMATAVALGGLGVAALNPLGVAGAQQDSKVEGPKAPEDRQGPLARALEGLVADGTLTQDQADAVLDATKTEVETGREQRSARHQELVAVVADALGSTPEEVKAAMKDGTSIANQAEAAGVDRQLVDDAVTELLAGRIETARADGRITDGQAAKATERLDQVVDRILDGHGGGSRRHGGHRFGPAGSGRGPGAGGD